MNDKPEAHSTYPIADGPDSRIGDIPTPTTISPIIAILALPFLLTAAGLSIPVTVVQRHLERRRERRIRAELEVVGRWKPWLDATSEVGCGRGTIIEESLSFKGPCRLWWTSEDLPLIAPFPCYLRRLHLTDRHNNETLQFFNWCQSEFTDLQTGKALILEVDPSSYREVCLAVDFLRAARKCVCVGRLPHD